jgi:cysteine desulfurase/selenocysteine lyase
VRAEFPILSRQINGKPLVYLDSAASSQRPRRVLRAVEHYETSLHANVHRGVHSLSQWATDAYEGARESVRRFLNARSTREIIFVRGTTEAINLVANSWGRGHLEPGDEILITYLEHHANIVPWQMICAATGARLRAAAVRPNGELDFDSFRAMLTPRPDSSRWRTCRMRSAPSCRCTRSCAWRMRAACRCCLTAPRLSRTNRSMCRTSTAIFMRSPDTRSMPPPASVCSTDANHCWQRCRPGKGGGDMIASVSIESSTYSGLPSKFEAGTPNISGAVGLGAALEYVESLGRAAIVATNRNCLVLPRDKRVSTAGIEAGRYGAFEGCRGLLHDGRRAPTRHWHGPGQRRHRDPYRTSLCDADH